ncbi:MAG: 50S ribosomal protein L35 [Candidatus Woesebacteria bacterium]|nr:50S ribosomal protein L35 [Candidatus Woesebacteria bacterium]
MPKLKTRKSLVKRFRITKNGKIMRRQSFRRHLKAHKSKKQLKNLKRTVQLKGFYAKKIHKATGTVVKKAKKGKKHGKS